MIKVTSLICLSLLFVSSLFAQIEISTGNIENPKKEPDVEEFLKINDSYFMVRKIAIAGPRGYDYIIEKFNNDAKFVKSVKVSGEENKRERIIEGIFQLGSSIGIIYSTEPPKIKKTQYKLELFDPVSLTSKKKVLLFSLPKEIAKKPHDIEINVSKTGKFFTASYITYVDYSSSVVAILHYTEEGEFMSDLLKNIAEKTTGLKLYQTLIADNGKVYLLVSKKDDIKEWDVHNWKILEADGEDFEEIEIESSNLHVEKMKISEGNDGNIIGAASFKSTNNSAEANYRQFTKGVYSFSLNSNTQKVSYSKVHPFSYNTVLTGWNKAGQKYIEGQFKIWGKKNWKEIDEQKEGVDDFSDFSLSDNKKMKDLIGFPDFRLVNVVQHNGQLLVLGTSGNKAVVYVNFNRSGNVEFAGKTGYEVNYGQPFEQYLQNGTPIIIFEDSYKSYDAKALEKDSYYGVDNTAYSVLIFDGSESPKKQLAFRLDQKPRTKEVSYLTKSQDGTELLFWQEKEGSGYQFGVIK